LSSFERTDTPLAKPVKGMAKPAISLIACPPLYVGCSTVGRSGISLPVISSINSVVACAVSLAAPQCLVFV